MHWSVREIAFNSCRERRTEASLAVKRGGQRCFGRRGEEERLDHRPWHRRALVEPARLGRAEEQEVAVASGSIRQSRRLKLVVGYPPRGGPGPTPHPRRPE